jgi:uncharacterized protein (TIGR02270 family)
MPTLPSVAEGSVLWDVVEEHLDEAEFLVEQWSGAARSARYNLAVLQKTIEPRLAAHLDALVVGGDPVADRLLWPLLEAEAEAPTAKIAAGVLALLLDPGVAVRDRLIGAFATATSEPVLAGLQLAMQLTARDDVDEPLRQCLYTTTEPAAQVALLSVLAARRVNPGPILTPLLGSADPDLVRAALTAAAVAATDSGAHRHVVEGYLTHEVPAVRTAALRTAFTWNLALGNKVCASEARAGSPTALLLLGLLAGAPEVTLLVSTLASEQHRRAALFALGFSGRKQAAEACLVFVGDADPAIAKLAAEAFSAITGFVAEKKIAPPDDTVEELQPPVFEDEEDEEDGKGAALAAAPPADELPPLEEDLDQDLNLQPEDDLPTPDADQIRRWWSEQAGAFATNQRYLAGGPISPESIETALRQGSLRRTGPLISEVAIRSAGRIQLPALRLALPTPALPAGLVMHREPGWH